MPAAFVAAQGAGDVAVGRLVDRGDEDGVGAAFEVAGVAVFGQPLEGGFEEDGLAEVGVPVAGVELCGVDGLAGDRRVERDRAGVRGDALQGFGEVAFDGFDVRGMRRVVDVDAARVDALGLAVVSSSSRAVASPATTVV